MMTNFRPLWLIGLISIVLSGCANIEPSTTNVEWDTHQQRLDSIAQYKANGKLLLSGEYFVLDGALALAVPTKQGQSMIVESTVGFEDLLEWESFDNEGESWFKGTFEKNSGLYIKGTDRPTGLRLQQIFQAGQTLNLQFLREIEPFKVSTHLDFPKNWGLGTSSTLINNLAQWANVDPYQLLKLTFGGSQKIPWIVTKYFPYKEAYKSTPYLKEVVVYFGSLIGRQKSKFRIRIYKKDLITGKPSDDIIKEEIIAFSRKIDGKVKINVSKFDFEIPKNGFFIGLERLHIPYNFYEYKYTMEGNRKKYIAKALAPNFAAVYTKDTIFSFRKGKWNKLYHPQSFYNGNQIQPAISLTLSN
mgnify:CR=1 FL=1